jgi:hypothetical protein
MNHGKRIVGALLFAGTLGAMMAVAPQPAEARGFRHRPVFVGGFYGPAFGFGWGPGFDPFWAPYPGGFYSRPYGGVDMNAAMIAGVGAVDLDVKPNRADVWVDGDYVGEARDLDGDPSYLWLKPGAHRIAIYRGGYRTFDEKVLVRRGMVRKLRVRLEAGESRPPGPKEPQE